MTGIYFSIYAVGMAGTAYGIYSLAFVRPILSYTCPRIVDGHVFAVQANEKGLDTPIDLFLQFIHTLITSSSRRRNACVNQ